METYCSVVGCKIKRSDERIRLFRFPEVNERCVNVNKNKLVLYRRKAWLKSLNRKNSKLCDLSNRLICSKHFISGSPADVNDINNPDWIPSIDMGRQTEISDSSLNDASQINSSQSLIEELDSSSNNVDIGSSKPHTEVSDSLLNNKSVRQHLDKGSNLDGNEYRSKNGVDVWAELQQRTRVAFQLKKQLVQLPLSEESLAEDKDKLRFYTALPNIGVFRLIQSAVEESLSSIKVPKLSNFQKLLITMMKLRLNCSFEDLGYRFGIRANTACSVFKKVIIILHFAFEKFIVWPDPEAANVLMPACFRRNFENSVAVVVDYFEIAIEKHAVSSLQEQSFSQHKQGTVKYLIGITPHGVVSFVSKSYDGLIGDREIIKTCGILEKLSTGDAIVADRGFTISKLFVEHDAEAKIPDFMHSKFQFCPKAMKNASEVMSVRVHVEQIIERIRSKYVIVNGPITISLLRNRFQSKGLLDYIVGVCCILTNLCD